MVARIAKDLLRNAGRTAHRMLGEDTYQRLLNSPAGQWAVRSLQSGDLISSAGLEMQLTDLELVRLHYREVEVTLSLSIQWVYENFIEGDIVEFGTATGFSGRVIARAMRFAEAARARKTLHLYDSFEGLPEARSEVDQNSFEFRSGVWAPGTMKALTDVELAAACAKFIGPEHVVTHKGWFSDTVPRLVPGQKFALVHFDGDMYQSTMDAVGGLLKAGAISNGAVICFDDWNCGQADPNYGERRAWRELIAQYGIQSSEWRVYSTMGRSFFIHDYRRG